MHTFGLNTLFHKVSNGNFPSYILYQWIQESARAYIFIFSWKKKLESKMKGISKELTKKKKKM